MPKIPFSDNMKFDRRTTLFITDLDGTFLTPDTRLPDGAAAMLHEFREQGIKLTYATARTIRSAAHILVGLPFCAPVALMNGVLLRDMEAGRYVEGNLLSSYDVEKILSAGGEPFVYTLTDDDELFTSYRRLANGYMEDFLKERVDKYAKPFRQVEDFHTLLSEGQQIIYFCYLDTEENLTPVYNSVSSLRDESGKPAVKCAFYSDHSRSGLWYLEVFAKTASKGNVCRRLREITGAETIVSFGDNANDLPMFAESDYAFAVERAGDSIKAAADGIVPGELGILTFIENHIIQE